MDYKAKIKMLELELALLKAKGQKTTKKAKPKQDIKAKAISWVKAKRGATKVLSEKEFTYKRKSDNKELKGVKLKFDNGETYAVGTAKFWKIK